MITEMKDESILITPETDKERELVEKLGDEGVRVFWKVEGKLGICSPRRAGLDDFYFDSDEKALIAFSLGRAYNWSKVEKHIETRNGQKTLAGLVSKILKFHYTVEPEEPKPGAQGAREGPGQRRGQVRAASWSGLGPELMPPRVEQ